MKVQFGLKGYGPLVDLDAEGRVLSKQEPLAPAEIGSAREAVSSLRLSWADAHNGWGISFDHLTDEGLVYAFKQNPKPDNRVKWVAFRLEYDNSGEDCNDLPDPEA